ncbi:MAG: PH domain-containing protein [Synergistaceae bacterium]|jgi:uncharacterized membrane protein YdbT with pleckstrin-like domain|nr:PH domain-containing protein [Synergistaceae bacterium]
MGEKKNEKKGTQIFRPPWRSFYWHMAGIVLCFVLIVWGTAHYPEYWKTITGLFFIVAAALAVHVAFRRLGVALLVKPEEVSLDQGFLGRHSVEISTPNIRTIQVSQRLMQRILDVGNLQIGSAATNDYEIRADNMPNPYVIRDLIQAYGRASENREITTD